ncbi:unnamed protein product [Pleuronectes platessa]|uniref:Uncharacterized protein n=1 Tax=Pleuronectes platessa TaxID=8262 RepID=A0A9N7ZDN3_PLEPL|nr:unnamed protein product [Pleuronectes platessa]
MRRRGGRGVHSFLSYNAEEEEGEGEDEDEEEGEEEGVHTGPVSRVRDLFEAGAVPVTSLSCGSSDRMGSFFREMKPAVRTLCCPALLCGDGGGGEAAMMLGSPRWREGRGG